MSKDLSTTDQISSDTSDIQDLKTQDQEDQNDLEDQSTQPPDPLTFDVGTYGPMIAGFRTWSHTYTPAPGLPERTILLNVWYPTTEPSNAFARYEKVFLDRDAFVDAPLADSLYGNTFPVHVHSHGHLGYGGTGADLGRLFASHGWIFIAPSHTENTIFDNVDPRHPSMYYKRGTDITAALDALETLPTDDPLHDKADTSNVVMSGYSFGVHTVWSVAGASFDQTRVDEHCGPKDMEMTPQCKPEGRTLFTNGLRESRIKAVIAQAGSIKTDWFGDTGQDSVTLPMLTMSGSKDPVGADEQYDKVSNTDIIWVDLEGACHTSFSAVGDCSTLEDMDADTMVFAYAMAFARYHILDDMSVSAILDGTQEVDKRVSFKRKTNK